MRRTSRAARRWVSAGSLSSAMRTSASREVVARSSRKMSSPVVSFPVCARLSRASRSLRAHCVTSGTTSFTASASGKAARETIRSRKLGVLRSLCLTQRNSSSSVSALSTRLRMSSKTLWASSVSSPYSELCRVSAVIAVRRRRTSVYVGRLYWRPNRTLHASGARRLIASQSGTSSSKRRSAQVNKNRQFACACPSACAVCIRAPRESTRRSTSNTVPSTSRCSIGSRCTSVSSICPDGSPAASVTRSISSRTTLWKSRAVHGAGGVRTR